MAITYKTVIAKAIGDFNDIQTGLHEVGAVYPGTANVIQAVSAGATLVHTSSIYGIITDQLQLKATGTYTATGAVTDADIKSIASLTIPTGALSKNGSNVFVSKAGWLNANVSLTVNSGSYKNSGTGATAVVTTVTVGAVNASNSYPVTGAATSNAYAKTTDFTAGWIAASAASTAFTISGTVSATIPQAVFAVNGSKVSVTAAGYIHSGTTQSPLYVGTVGGTTIAVSGTSANYIGTATAGWLAAGWVSVRNVTATATIVDNTAGGATPSIINSNEIALITNISGKVSGTDYWAITPSVTTTKGSVKPKYSVTTSGWVGNTVTGTATDVNVTANAGTALYIPKATFNVDGSAVKTSTAGYIPESITVGTVAGGAISGTYLTTTETGNYPAVTTAGWISNKQYVKAGAVSGTYLTTTETSFPAVTTVGWIGTKQYVKAGTATVNNKTVYIGAVTVGGNSASTTFTLTGNNTGTTGATITAGWISTVGTGTITASLSGVTLPKATFNPTGSTVIVTSAGYIAKDTVVGTIGSGTMITTDASSASTTYSAYTAVSEWTSNSLVVPAEGYLIIGAGYYPNLKISLGTLIPDDSNLTNAGNAHIRANYEAYDTTGKKLVGTIPDYTPGTTYFTSTNTGFGVVTGGAYVATATSYIKAGSATVSAKTVAIKKTDVTITGDSSSTGFTFAGTSSTTTGAAITAGWISTATAGTVTASLSTDFVIPSATVSYTKTAATSFTPAINVYTTDGTSSGVNVTGILQAANAATTEPSSGNYIAMQVPSQDTKTIYVSAKVSTSGYAAKDTIYTNNTTVGFNSKTVYFPIDTPTITVASNASKITFTTDKSGYIKASTWSSTVGAAAYTAYGSYMKVTTAGWIATGDYGSKTAGTLDSTYASTSNAAPYTAGNAITTGGWISSAYIKAGVASVTGGAMTLYSNTTAATGSGSYAIAYAASSTSGASSVYVRVSANTTAVTSSTTNAAGWVTGVGGTRAAQNKEVFIPATTATTAYVTPTVTATVNSPTVGTATTFNSTTGSISAAGAKTATTTAGAEAGAKTATLASQKYIIKTITYGVSAAITSTKNGTATIAANATGSSVDEALQSLYNRMLGQSYTEIDISGES